MLWSVLVVGAALVGGGCGPSDAMEAGNATQGVDESDPEGRFCGGLAAIPCPSGYICVDDPADTCDPAQGGRDCSGRCTAATAATCGDEPGDHYVLTDPARCQGVLFKCATGLTAFFNDCGCGCGPE
ncbi:hypothetical protein BON30_00740 [Cystobacter ferrugineus]|uniref:Kazal-like domain-containing protein n=2 Tax=Cystobacter ferrugineus TaxID=83449 RepID=A0A1L9BHP1_9BACT|nr:hypothetical protein BON30_00740 [Cystobacter ferrugineus]